MIDQKQLENVISFKYFGNNLTNDGKCIFEMKPRIGMAEAAFNRTRGLFTVSLVLKLRKKLAKCYIWSVALYGAETGALRAVEAGKFCNVVLEKDGEDQLDRSCEKWRCVT